MSLQLSYHRERLSDAAADAMVADLVALLEHSALSLDVTPAQLQDLLDRLAQERAQVTAQSARSAARSRLQRSDRRRTSTPAPNG